MSDQRRILAVITYENGQRITWECPTVASAVLAWHREMTAPRHADNPAVRVEWLVGEPGATTGVVIGAMIRPDAPRSEAWAQVVGATFAVREADDDSAAQELPAAAAQEK